MGRVIEFPTLRGLEIPARLVRDVLAGGEWDSTEYAAALRDLCRWGETVAPTYDDARTVQRLAAAQGIPTTVHGGGWRWFVTRVRGEVVS